jgi:hypothetical protein
MSWEQCRLVLGLRTEGRESFSAEHRVAQLEPRLAFDLPGPLTVTAGIQREVFSWLVELPFAVSCGGWHNLA